MRYHKASAQLLQLRDLEYAYAIRKDFDRAEYISKRAKKLEEEEVVTQRNRAINSMRTAYQTMEEKHEKERSCLMMREVKETEKIERDHQRRTRPYEIQIEKCEGELAYLAKEGKSARKKPEMLSTRILRSPATLKGRDVKARVMIPVEGLDVRRFCKKRAKAV
jgi:hypothetical protein